MDPPLRFRLLLSAGGVPGITSLAGGESWSGTVLRCGAGTGQKWRGVRDTKTSGRLKTLIIRGSRK